MALLPRIVAALLARGVGVNDRDGLTDCTMLHFSAKAAAPALGCTAAAVDVIADLLRRGADPSARSAFTDMTPLHLAAFFGADGAVSALLAARSPPDVNAQCAKFEQATPLHLAAMAGAPETVSALVSAGANVAARDLQRRTPLDCAKIVASKSKSIPSEIWDEVFALLQRRSGTSTARSGAKSLSASSSASSRPQSASATARRDLSRPTTASSTRSSSAGGSSRPDIAVGSRVSVNGTKVGTVRFVGAVDFRPGEWFGVELDMPLGKNDGSVNGIRYFRCKQMFGVFVQRSGLSPFQERSATQRR